jgi:hypothetical protein
LEALLQFLQPVETVHPRPADSHTARYVRSFLILRTVVGVLGIALPFLLVLVEGVWFDGSPFLRESLSAYYYSGARELFVGGLSAIGVFLFTYKVAESNLDNTLSLLAGLSVVVVALFPTSRPSGLIGLTAVQDRLGESVVAGIHFSAAGLFILSLALISYFFGKREGRPREGGPPRQRSLRFWRKFPLNLRCPDPGGVPLERRNRADGLGPEPVAPLRRGRRGLGVRRLVAVEGAGAGHAARRR